MTPGFWVLPAVIAVPLLGAILVMVLPRDEHKLALGMGFGFSLLAFALSLACIGFFQAEVPGFQMVFSKEWIPGLGASFKVGIDGISLWLVVLTTFTTPIVMLSAFSSVGKKVREFVAAMLILEVGMIGAFVALDMFLFYVFWEIMLIPMYLLIGIWGGHRRIYASIKFVIYTMIGSLLMLVAIFYVYVKYQQQVGEYTMDYTRMVDVHLSQSAQLWCFAAFALAFAIKVPLFPLHTWLPDAHVEAPTAGSVILAGVLLKFGIYGFLRFAMPMFPYGAHTLAPYIAILAVIGIIYGAFVAFAQEDVKKLIAYSSVSHLGFCALGIFALTPAGVSGSIYAMLSHGLTTGGLFLAIGVLYERRHTRRMSEYGGLWAQMPVFAGVFLIITLGSAGLPGLSGFIGEFMTIFGTFTADPNDLPMPRLFGALAATGVILGAVYLLYMFQRMMFGPIKVEANRSLKDLSGREIAVFTPLVLMIFFMGLYPKPFLSTMEPAVKQFINRYQIKLAKSKEEPQGFTVQQKAAPATSPDVRPRAESGQATPPNRGAAGTPPRASGPRGGTPVPPPRANPTTNQPPAAAQPGAGNPNAPVRPPGAQPGAAQPGVQPGVQPGTRPRVQPGNPGPPAPRPAGARPAGAQPAGAQPAAPRPGTPTPAAPAAGPGTDAPAANTGGGQ